MARRGTRRGLCLAVLVLALAATAPSSAHAARRRLSRATDAKELTDRLRAAGSRKVALMLNPDARPLGSTAARDHFAAVERDAARARLTVSELTDGVRHEGLKATAMLQTKAKIGVDEFARGEALAREQRAAREAADAAAQGGGNGSVMLGKRRSEALGLGTAGAGSASAATPRLVPESGAYARPGDVTLRAPVGARQAAPQQPAAAPGDDALVAAASDAFGRRGGKSTTATRAIYGFNNLASGLPNFLSRALAGRTTVTSV